MKITINVDCTPEEARSFLGLPDVKPIQDAGLEALKAQMDAAFEKMDPEMALKTVFPSNIEGIDALQKAFWAQFTGQNQGK